MNRRQRVTLMLLCFIPPSGPRNGVPPIGISPEKWARRMSSSPHTATASIDGNTDVERTQQSISTTESSIPATEDFVHNDLDCRGQISTTHTSSNDKDNSDIKRNRQIALLTFITRHASSSNFENDDNEATESISPTTIKRTLAPSDEVDLRFERFASNLETESAINNDTEMECLDDETDTQSIARELMNNANNKPSGIISDNSSKNVSDYFEVVLNFSKTLCPYTRFCDQSPLSEIMNDAEAPCCDDCSCDEECGLRVDCCFEEMDKYKLKKNEKLICVETKKMSSNLQTGGSSYLMVKECLCNESNRLVNDQNMSDINDHNTKGSYGESHQLYPVYSTSTNFIYYNNSTAVCNNVFDGIAWQRFLSCERPRGGISLSDAVAKSMSSGNCWTDFLPPLHMNTKHFQCYQDVIDRCNITGDIYHYSLLTKHACETLQAPYHLYSKMFAHKKTFANVHCFKCNTNTFKHECYQHPTKSRLVQFTVLINEKAIDELFETSTVPVANLSPGQTATDCAREYVRHPFMAECRLLKCAEGKYNVGEECRFISNQWYIWSEFSMVLFVEPDMYIPVDDVLSTEGEEIKNVLKKKGFFWQFTQIFYHQTQEANATLVRYFMIRLMKDITTREFDLSQMITKLESTIKNGWRVKIYNRKYHLSVNIDKGYDWVSQKGDGVFELVRNHLQRGNEPEPEMIYELSKHGDITTNRITAPFLLTRLYFCRRVQLENDDYSEDGSNLILFPNTTKRRRLYSSQFSLLKIGERKTTSEITKVHVCVEDFAPELLYVSNSDTIAHGVSHWVSILILLHALNVNTRFF